MTKRMRHLVTAVAAIAALATGGAVFAQAQNSGSNAAPASKSSAQQKQAPERESSASENSATDKDNVQDENGKDDATEASGSETPDKPGDKGSEVANDDGPGGHADEPGNANADHQSQGAE